MHKIEFQTPNNLGFNEKQEAQKSRMRNVILKPRWQPSVKV